MNILRTFKQVMQLLKFNFKKMPPYPYVIVKINSFDQISIKTIRFLDKLSKPDLLGLRLALSRDYSLLKTFSKNVIDYVKCNNKIMVCEF